MLKFIATVLAFTTFGGTASADPDNHRDHRPVVRNHEPQRVNRPAQRANRRVIARRPVYVDNGRFAFGGGVSRVYTRPTIRARYYNARVRPLVIVENYRPEPGYVWVRGEWAWSGREWQWGDGHYMPDPQYLNYYDDGSYDYSVNLSIGG